MFLRAESINKVLDSGPTKGEKGERFSRSEQRPSSQQNPYSCGIMPTGRTNRRSKLLVLLRRNSMVNRF